MKRSQPWLTNATWPSESVIHISTGAVSASSRNCASESRTASSWRARSAAAPITFASDCRKWASSGLKCWGVRLWTPIPPNWRPLARIWATSALTMPRSRWIGDGSKRISVRKSSTITVPGCSSA